MAAAGFASGNRASHQDRVASHVLQPLLPERTERPAPGRQAFCRAQPGAGALLGQSGRDPDVERLLEGFAFLTGRLRQKLDDELPELTHSLMHLLWPNYMRP